MVKTKVNKHKTGAASKYGFYDLDDVFDDERDLERDCDEYETPTRRRAEMTIPSSQNKSRISKEEFDRRVSLYQNYHQLQIIVNNKFDKIDVRHLRFSKIGKVYEQLRELFKLIKRSRRSYEHMERYSSLLKGMVKRFDNVFLEFTKQLEACRIKNPARFDETIRLENLMKLKRKIYKKEKTPKEIDPPIETTPEETEFQSGEVDEEQSTGQFILDMIVNLFNQQVRYLSKGVNFVMKEMKRWFQLATDTISDWITSLCMLSLKNKFCCAVKTVKEFVVKCVDLIWNLLKRTFKYICSKIIEFGFRGKVTSGTEFQSGSDAFSGFLRSIIPVSFRSLYNGLLSSIGRNVGNDIYPGLRKIYDIILNCLFPTHELKKFNEAIVQYKVREYITEFHQRNGNMDFTGDKRNGKSNIKGEFEQYDNSHFLRKGRRICSFLEEHQDVIRTHEMRVQFEAFIRLFEQKFHDILQAKNEGSRPEPIGIVISGESGIGKTTLCTEVLPYLFLGKHLGSNDDVRNEIYSAPMNVDEKYDVGYAGQLWFYRDDMGSRRDGSDMLDLLQKISTSECYVTMADLRDKGTCFKSRVVCGSTNYTALNIRDLQSSEPLGRRDRKSVV